MFIGAKWWWQLDYRSYKPCKAPVKSSPLTNQHPFFTKCNQLNSVQQKYILKMHIDSCDMQLCVFLLSTTSHNSKAFSSCCRRLAARKRPEVVRSPAAYSRHSVSRQLFRSRYFLHDCLRSCRPTAVAPAATPATPLRAAPAPTSRKEVRLGTPVDWGTDTNLPRRCWFVHAGHIQTDCLPTRVCSPAMSHLRTTTVGQQQLPQ